MFYANLSIEHMREADYEEAFAYLKLAALTAGDNPDIWINLGAVYSMLNHDVYAEQAYQVARSIDGKDQAAISGLAKVLRKQGRVEEAEVFATLALRYQPANPYYHYAKAEQAFNAGAFDQALTAINRAIKLKRRNPQSSRGFGQRSCLGLIFMTPCPVKLTVAGLIQPSPHPVLQWLAHFQTVCYPVA